MPVTVEGISKRLRMPKPLIKRAFTFLKGKGLLLEVGDNKYSPSKRGIALYKRRSPKGFRR